MSGLNARRVACLKTPGRYGGGQGILKRMGTSGVTVHGFRSTFRDWASESARADREVAELCLAHLVGNYVEQAYARSELLERRRELLNLWTQFVLGETGKIIQLGR